MLYVLLLFLSLKRDGESLLASRMLSAEFPDARRDKDTHTHARTHGNNMYLYQQWEFAHARSVCLKIIRIGIIIELGDKRLT